MRVLVDTNILLRSMQSNHPLFAQASYAVSALLRRNDSVFFCPQNIVELWNVATRPSSQNGLGMTPEDALREVGSIEKSLFLLPESAEIYVVWKRIVAAHRVQGVKVHDARLVATMNVYSLDSLLTFNVADFQRFAGITTIHPSALVP